MIKSGLYYKKKYASIMDMIKVPVSVTVTIRRDDVMHEDSVNSGMSVQLHTSAGTCLASNKSALFPARAIIVFGFPA
jgi:hypothetical protein